MKGAIPNGHVGAAREPPKNEPLGRYADNHLTASGAW